MPRQFCNAIPCKYYSFCADVLTEKDKARMEAKGEKPSYFDQCSKFNTTEKSKD